MDPSEVEGLDELEPDMIEDFANDGIGVLNSKCISEHAG